VGEAILHGHRHGAAQGVEPEQRTAGQHIDAIDRNVGDHVPVHGIAERFVDTHAVLVNGEPLRGAQYRRSLEAAVENIGLEGICQSVVDVDAAQLRVQRARQIGRALSFEIGAVQALDIARNLVGIEAQARHGCRADDQDLG
jgi:hypothetical protein